MKVIGNTLYKGGSKFYPKGWNSVAGLYARPNLAKAEYIAANAQMTSGSTLNVLKTQWQANTIRFQVNQTTLANDTPISDFIMTTYADLYTQQLQALISQAVASGFVCILCMMDEFFPPGGNLTKIKTESGFIDHTNYGNNWTYTGDTTNAWLQLSSAFAASTNVMFEIFNETHMGYGNAYDSALPYQVTDPQWTLWNAHNQGIIDTIRSEGANNVCIAGAKRANLVFTGYTPALTDSVGGCGIMYAVHPYNWNDPGVNNPKGWDDNWGRLTDTVPVIATEWYNVDYNQVGRGSADFLNYCKSKNVGMTAWVFDDYKDPLPNTKHELISDIVVDLSDYTVPWIWNLTPMGVEYKFWMQNGYAWRN